MVEKLVSEDEAIAAEDQAAAAESARALLANAALHDDAIEFEQVEEAEKLGKLARFKAARVRAKAVRSKDAIRLAAAEALRAEIEDYAQGDGERFAGLLAAVGAAEREFLNAAWSRTVQLGGWTQRAKDLGIPESDGRPVPSATDGKLALGRGSAQLHAGRRVLRPFDGPSMLENYRTRPSDREAILRNVAALDGIEAESTYEHFYRGPGGAVIGRNDPFTEAEVKRLELVKLTKTEVWGE